MLWLKYLTQTHEIFTLKTGAQVLLKSFFRTTFVMYFYRQNGIVFLYLIWHETPCISFIDRTRNLVDIMFLVRAFEVFKFMLSPCAFSVLFALKLTTRFISETHGLMFSYWFRILSSWKHFNLKIRDSPANWTKKMHGRFYWS